MFEYCAPLHKTYLFLEVYSEGRIIKGSNLSGASFIMDCAQSTNFLLEISRLSTEHENKYLNKIKADPEMKIHGKTGKLEYRDDNNVDLHLLLVYMHNTKLTIKGN